MKKLLPALFLVPVLAIGLYFLVSRKDQALQAIGAEKPAAPPPTAQVERRNLTEEIMTSGDVAASLQVEIKPEVSGKIKTLAVHTGDSVKPGQLLVELDDKDLLTEKGTTQVQIAGAKLSLDKALRDFERTQKLFERNLISREAFDNAKTELDTSKNNHEQALGRLRTVEDKLFKTKIVAPFDGTILSIPVVEGQVVVAAASVSSGTLLMSMADLSHMQIATHVNQVDIAKLKVGQTGEITVDSLPGVKIEGAIGLISPLAVVKNNIKGFTVTVTIRTRDERLKPGMTADVRFVVGKSDQALVVPLAGVFTEDDESKVVYLPQKSAGAPKKTTVTLGIVNFDYAEIKSGLKEGDSILLVKPKEAGGG